MSAVERLDAAADLLSRVRAAVAYSYEAGDYPEDMDPDVATYVVGDGGLLITLNLAVDLSAALRDVLDLHRDAGCTCGLKERSEWCPPVRCDSCRQPYPCATRAAIEKRLETP